MEFVRIVFGETPAVIPQRNIDAVCIIGNTANDIGVVQDVNAGMLNPTNITVDGLQETDQLYKAAMQFFRVNPTGRLVLASIPSAGETKTDSELIYRESNIWDSGYSPVSDIQNIEVYVSETITDAYTGTADGLSYDVSPGWYVVTDGVTITTSDSVRDGTVTVEYNSTANRLRFQTTDESDGTTTVYIDYDLDTTNDRLRADVVLLPLSITFGRLLDPNIAFEIFLFGYDATADDRYAETMNGSSWLNDVIVGIKMCEQFAAAQKRCLFAFGLPEKVKPNEVISDTLAAGTPYTSAGTPIKYEELEDKLGQHKFVMMFATKQLVSDLALDPAIAGAGDLSRIAKRDPLTFTQSIISNDEWPNEAERMQWRRADTNAYINIVPGNIQAWGNNRTMGEDINHMRCKIALAYRLEEALLNFLFTKPTYDAVGIRLLRSVIQSTMKSVVGLYIDGVGTINIPIEYYVNNESKLDEGEKMVLASARASKRVDNIEIGYKFNGNIEFITISALISEV